MYGKIVLVFLSLLVLLASGLVQNMREVERFFSRHSESCSHAYFPKALGSASSSLVHWVNCD
ncbi:MAG: hypothetical protein EBQ85_06075 [Proteobacteria bacterium]|nr:hypothetical protein [Pseudomonadota bacterium]